MHDLKARPARESDLPVILELLADDVLGQQREQIESPTPAHYYAAFDAIHADKNQLLAVFEYQHHLVGCCVYDFSVFVGDYNNHPNATKLYHRY